ncbi:MAG: hypothetical protein ABL886_07570, partial [Rhodoglobus sp.]
NGDLTDDAPTEWKANVREGKEGAKTTTFSGGGSFEIGPKGQPFAAHVSMYRYNPKDEGRAGLTDGVVSPPGGGVENYRRLRKETAERCCLVVGHR